MIYFILLIVFSPVLYAESTLSCSKVEICLSSIDQTTAAMEWIGPKEKIWPGLKNILTRSGFKVEKFDSNLIQASNSSESLFFKILDKEKKIDLKISSNSKLAKKEDLIKKLEEIKFKYFQRDF